MLPPMAYESLISVDNPLEKGKVIERYRQNESAYVAFISLQTFAYTFIVIVL